MLAEEDVHGSEIRLRYRVHPEFRDAARAAAAIERERLLSLGAASCKVEEIVIPTTRARAPEVARATTLVDKLRALRSARGDTLSEDRVERLNVKVATLEEERHHAS